MSLIINKKQVDKIKIQDSPKSVFCSIPRTASNGMTVYLLNGYLLEGFESIEDHTTICYADRFIAGSHRKYNHFIDGYEDVHEGLKFATVRNTYDRLVSLCEYIRMYSDSEDSKITESDKIEVFKKYLYLVKEVRERKLDNEFGIDNALPQLLYIQNDGIMDVIEYSKQNVYTLDKINIGVDYLLQYEILEQDYAELCVLLKIPNKFGDWYATKSKRMRTRVYYDSENKDIVEDLFGFEIEYFGYKL